MWEIFKDAVQDLFTGWSKLLRTRCGYLDMPCGLALVFAAIFALMNIPVLAKLIPYINKKLDNRKDESH